MKKISILLILLIVSTLMSFATENYNIGDKIDDVLYTDIITEINGHEVESFNINGSTAIYVSEIKKLGYDVVWNGDKRVVEITNNPENNPIYEENKLSLSNASNHSIGDRINDVLYTDIKTFIDGKAIKSFNIKGSTAIYAAELRNTGATVKWNDDTRRVIISNVDVDNKNDNERNTSTDDKETKTGKTYTDTPTEQTASIYYNNEKIDFGDTPPIVDESDEVWISASLIGEALGTRVRKVGNTVELEKDDTFLIFTSATKNYFYNDTYESFDEKLPVVNNEIMIPSWIIENYFDIELIHRELVDVRFDGVKRHVVDLRTDGFEDLESISDESYGNTDKTNPFGEKVGYIDGDIFDLTEFNKNPDGSNMDEETFTNQSLFFGYGEFQSQDFENVYVWSPKNPVVGQGRNYKFFEGLDALQDAFNQARPSSKYSVNDIEYDDFYPKYVVDYRDGYISSKVIAYKHKETGEIYENKYVVIPKEEDAHNWLKTTHPDLKNYYNEWWHFGLSNYKGTNLFFPRITLDRWYDLSNYEERGEITPYTMAKVRTVKPLIQFWSNSQKDSQMIWRTIEFVIRGTAFPEDQTEEYDAILENLRKGTIVEYPDGTRIKFLDMYGHGSGTMAAEFLFMSLPFEEESFQKSIYELRD